MPGQIDLSLLNVTPSLDSISKADWIIEAVVERIDIKQNIYNGGRNNLELEKSRVLFDKQIENFYITFFKLSGDFWKFSPTGFFVVGFQKGKPGHPKSNPYEMDLGKEKEDLTWLIK